MMPFPEFEVVDVESDTTTTVREAIGAGHGCAIVGRAGVGKTHAVARAVNGAVWTTVPSTAFAVPRVLADLASQTGATEAVMQAYELEGCEAACASLGASIGDRVVVFDAVEHLASRQLDAFEELDTGALWSGEVESLRKWALGRVDHTKTIVVGRWIADPPPYHVVLPPSDSPVKPTSSQEIYADWNSVAERLQGNPAALFLAAATLRLSGPRQMTAWLSDTAQADPREATVELGRIFRSAVPGELGRVLAMLGAAGELEAGILEDVAAEDEELDFGLELARDLHLLEERAGVTRLVPFLHTAQAVPKLEVVGADLVLKRVATRVLAHVNDRGSLEPRSARRVLDAHRMQLAAGDIDGALTTARLHVGGLIAHTRSTSTSARGASDYDRARRFYSDIRKILEAHPRYEGTHVRSYVDHYHGYNGYRAQTLGLDEVARDYDAAIDAWTENALWHARRIALTAERGDTRGALAMQKAAYEVVEPHERRDAYLQVRAARWACDAGAHLAAVQLLEDYEAPPSLSAVDPVAAHYLQRLRRRWARGVEVTRLFDADGREVAFHAPISVTIERSEDGWCASTEFPPVHADGPGPWSAVQALAAAIADECLRLVRTPTGRLEKRDVGRKGLYLGTIDLAASQIGLPYHSARWLLGEVSGRTFTPTHVDLDPVEIAPDIVVATDEGQYFARVPVDRTGHPSGPVTRLVGGGSGQRLDELLFALRRLTEEDGHAA